MSLCHVAFRYHHTGPVSGFFALRESLAILAERVKGYFPTSSVTFLNKKSVILRYCYSLYTTQISKKVSEPMQSANKNRI